MKLEPVINLEEKHGDVKKIDDDVMSANCDVIIFFPIYGQFVAIRKPDFRRMVYKTYILIKNNLFILEKLKTELKISDTALMLTQLLYSLKNGDFLQKKCWHQQSQEVLGTKRYLFWTYLCVSTYLQNFKFLS